MGLLGNWSQDLVLLFNNIGKYCEVNRIKSDDAERMFNAGIVARHQGRLGDFATIYDDPQAPAPAIDAAA